MPNPADVNKSIPSVSQPTWNPQAVLTVLLQLKAGMDVLRGDKGGLKRAVTFEDLVTLGLLTQPAAAAVASGGSGSVDATSITGVLSYLQLPPEVRNLVPNPIHLGTMLAGELVALYSINQKIILPANLVDWTVSALIAPYADVALAVWVYQSAVWTLVGNLTVHTDMSVSYPTSDAVTLLKGDVVKIIGPASPDPLFADFAIGSMFKRGD